MKYDNTENTKSENLIIAFWKAVGGNPSKQLSYESFDQWDKIKWAVFAANGGLPDRIIELKSDGTYVDDWSLTLERKY